MNFEIYHSPHIHQLNNVHLAETTCLKSISYRQTFWKKSSLILYSLFFFFLKETKHRKNHYSICQSTTLQLENWKWIEGDINTLSIPDIHKSFSQLEWLINLGGKKINKEGNEGERKQRINIVVVVFLIGRPTLHFQHIFSDQTLLTPPYGHCPKYPFFFILSWLFASWILPPFPLLFILFPT